MSEKPKEKHDLATIRLWDIQWVRDLTWIAGFVILFLLIFSIRAVVIPVLIALALAYIVNPAIVWMNKRWKLPRVAGTSVFMGAGAVFVLLLSLLIVPLVLSQLDGLVRSVGGYTRYTINELGPLIDQYIPELHGRSDDGREDAATEDEVDAQATADGEANTEPSESGNDAPPADCESPTPANPQQPTATEKTATDESGDAPAQDEQSKAQQVIKEVGDVVEVVADDEVSSGEPSVDQGGDASGGERKTLADALNNVELGQILTAFFQALNIGVGVVTSAFALAMYLMISAFLIAFCFFFFSWHFNRIVEWFDQFVPDSQHEKVVHIARRMDKSVSAFVRGRLIQSFVMAMILSVGWYFAGVPYFILLGVLGGILNLVPYAASVGWIAAVALTVVDRLSGGGVSAAGDFTIWILIWPTLVYFAAQLIDGWVVEPVVQGAATELDPLAVLLAVIIGGSLAGLLGLILAIPATACLKILAEEVILPRLRASRVQNGKGSG